MRVGTEHNDDPLIRPTERQLGFYSVPLVTEGLSHRETVTQICDVMRHLQRVSDDVVQRVSARTTASAAKLQTMNDRVAKLGAKVASLQQSTKPIQLVCPGVYPIDPQHDLATVPRLFSSGRPPTIRWTKIPFNELVQSYHTSDTPLDSQQIHVRTNRLRLDQLSSDLHCQPSGHCRRLIPPALRSAASLLVNDTCEAAYGDVNVNSDDDDNLAMTTDQLLKADVLDADGSSLTDTADFTVDTPQSLLIADDADDEEQESFWYTPRSGDVPDLAAPLSLPGLSSAALDLSLPAPVSLLSDSVCARTIQSERPSLLPALSVDSDCKRPLPSVVAVRPDKPEPSPDATVKPKRSVPTTVTGCLSEMDLKPTGDLVVTKEETVEAPAVSIPVAPPMPFSIVPKQAETSDTGDMRSALMDAIRQAGGAQNAKLKKKVDQNQVRDTAKKVDSGSSGDLMSDLAAKLMLRRKGISGNNARTEVDASDLLSRMSSLIPPPPTDSPQSTAINSEDDQDWD